MCLLVIVPRTWSRCGSIWIAIQLKWLTSESSMCNLVDYLTNIGPAQQGDTCSTAVKLLVCNKISSSRSHCYLCIAYRSSGSLRHCITDALFEVEARRKIGCGCWGSGFMSHAPLTWTLSSTRLCFDRRDPLHFRLHSSGTVRREQWRHQRARFRSWWASCY